MPIKEWKTFGAFMFLMAGLAFFDHRLAMWTIGAVAVTIIIKNPDIIRLPFR